MKTLPSSARIYISAVYLAGFALAIWHVAVNPPTQSLPVILILCALGSLSLIFKAVGATEGSHYNLSFLIYAFTFIHLGASETVVVVVVSNVLEWIVRKYPWHIQLFNIAQYMIALEGARRVFQSTTSLEISVQLGSILATIAALAAFTIINHLLIGVVLWLAKGENLRKSGVMDFFPLMLDFTFLVLGAGMVLLYEANPYSVVLAIVPLYLIYNSLRVPDLKRKSEIDPKTGLLNARSFDIQFRNELIRSNRFNRPLTIVMADLDLLRNINNSYGHIAGDEVLKGVAKILSENVREFDIVARFGGEEFVIMMPETTSSDALPLVERIRELISTGDFLIPTSVTPIKITISMGIASRDQDDHQPDELIHNADLALYNAKLTGRNRTSVYTDEAIQQLFERRGDGQYAIPSQLTMAERTQSYNYEPSTLRTGYASQSPPDQMPGPPAPVSKPKSARTKAGKPGPQSYALGLMISLLVSLSVALWLIGIGGQDLGSIEWLGLLAIGVLVILTELLSVDIYVRDTSVSTSAAPILAGTLLFGPLGGGIMSVLFAISTYIKHRSPLNRLVFNAANQLLAGMLYLLPLILSGANFNALSLPIKVVVCLVAILIVYFSTTIMVALAVHLDKKIQFWDFWKANFSWLSPVYLMLGLLSFTLVFSYQLLGVLGILAVILPLLILRFSQMQYIDRTRGVVKQLRQSNTELNNKSEQINALNKDLLATLARVIDMRDPFVLGHSQQVVSYAVRIAQKLDLPDSEIEIVRKAALLHDIGKLGIPDQILSKPEDLTREEYEIVKHHVHIGAEIVKHSESLKDVVPIIMHHHERYDGAGYPDGQNGDEILMATRIVSLADAVEAMASDRPYRRSLSRDQIIREVMENRGRQFDPKVVDAFLEIIAEEQENFIVNSSEYVLMEKEMLRLD